MSAATTFDNGEQPERPGRVRAAYAWAAGGTFGGQAALWLLSLAVMGVLQPSDYGLVGIISVFYSYCRTVQDAGLSTAIVQRPELNRKLLSSAFWFYVSVGILLMAVGIVTAPLLGRLYHEPRLPAVMRVLAVNFIFLAVRTIPTALLTRALNFRQRSTAEVAGSAANALTTAGLAFTGHGVWSLVIGGIVGEASLTLLICWFARWRPAAEFDRAELFSLLHFGLPVMGSALIWEFYIQSDFLMIGLILGPQQLGWYTLAWQLGMIPADRLTAVMNKANLPVLASLQKEPERLRTHWRKVIEATAWLTFPMAAGLVLMGSDLIHTVLPAKWAGAEPVLPQLALLGGIRSIAIVIPNLLTAVGRPGSVFIYNCVAAIIYPSAFALSARLGGIAAVGWAWVAISSIMTLWLGRLGLKMSPIKLDDYFSPLRAPLLCTLSMSLVVLALKQVSFLSGLARVAVLVGAGVFSYAAFGFASFRRFMRNR